MIELQDDLVTGLEELIEVQSLQIWKENKNHF